MLMPLSSALVLFLAAPVIQAAAPSKALFLDHETFDPLSLPQPTQENAAVLVIQAQGSAREILDDLTARGAEVLGYLPEDAYLVRLTKQARFHELRGVRFVGAFRPQWKRSRALQKIDPKQTTRLWVQAFRGRPLVPSVFQPPSAGHFQKIGHDSGGTGWAVVEVTALHLESVLETLTQNPDVAWVEPERNLTFNNNDSAWVVQGGNQTTPLFSQGLTGYNQIIGVADTGLDTDACQFRLSSDQSAQTFLSETQPPDVNLSTDLHPNNKVISYFLINGATAYDDRSRTGHGTRVTGCAAGDNYAHLATALDAGHDTQDGMAPAAKIVFQDIGRRDGMINGETNFLDLYIQAHQAGARIHNNSYGTTEINTEYSAASSDIDQAAWQMPDLLIVFSAGNQGHAASSLDGMGTTSKNTVVVGASLAGANIQGRGVCAFSSQGPTSDGRLRPDLVAPGAVMSSIETAWVAVDGQDIYGQPLGDSTTDPPNNNCSVDTTYQVGTSFSAPLVAGSAALVRQYFIDGYYPTGERLAGNGFEPSAALLKAILVNSAESITGPLYDTTNAVKIANLEPAPNNVQGWGLIQLDRALYFKGDPERLAVLTDTWSDGRVKATARVAPMIPDRVDSYIIQGVIPGLPLKITLVWTDPAGTAGAGKALVNDLDLEAQDANGNIYKGNVGFTNNRSTPAGALAADNINTLEQIIIDSLVEQDVIVRVIGRAIPGNGLTIPYPSTQQGYALVAVGNFQQACLQGQCESTNNGDSGDNGSDQNGDGGISSKNTHIVGGCACDQNNDRSLFGLFILVMGLLWRKALFGTTRSASLSI